MPATPKKNISPKRSTRSPARAKTAGTPKRKQDVLHGLKLWYYPTIVQHSFWFIMISLVAMATRPLIPADIPLTLQAVVLGVSVFGLGLPHGALDHIVGQRAFEPIFGKYWLLAFLAYYLGILVGVMYAWVSLPIEMLGFYLAFSAIHFGRADAGDMANVTKRRQEGFGFCVDILVRGILPLAFATYFHVDESSEVFAWLMGWDSGTPRLVDLVAQSSKYMILICIPCVLVRAYSHHQNCQKIWPSGMDTSVDGTRDHETIIPSIPYGWLYVFEIIAFAGIFNHYPVLLGFIFYFCLWHSARHMLLVASDYGEPQTNAFIAVLKTSWLGFLMSVATIVLVVGAYVFLDLQTANFDRDVIRIVFMGLAAVALPHMMLIESQALQQKLIPHATHLIRLGRKFR
eukprot:Clim_evm8s64 gene=Clim_evmTU8s64